MFRLLLSFFVDWFSWEWERVVANKAIDRCGASSARVESGISRNATELSTVSFKIPRLTVLFLLASGVPLALTVGVHTVVVR